ncbi:MAG: single-stranded-DNA-specific exonuclease RecJ [Candidatus Pacebacteria bacterium]|nr:single-stranded-DNA-specific exonuclease RecJ [Candidatus Paceibacterota bacterium]
MQKYGELLRTLLEKRGIVDEAGAGIFLNPDYERDFHDPFLMRDMKIACARILDAIEKGEKIIIYADYDCDGIPGAVILSDFFKQIGYKNYEVYIPQRNSEGYGLNLEAIKQFKESKVKLLITIDLGITAVEEVAQAKKDGIDVIVTDHHIPQAILPKACAILNPKVDDYPEKMLCGAGVVFKLIQGLIKFTENGEIAILADEDCLSEASYAGKKIASSPFFKGFEKWMLDMAGLATLSDMVPLTGENRAIAYFGMKVLKKSPRPGLQKLLSKMNIDQRYLSEDDVGFMITPRLNAASRMDNPMRAYEVLSTIDAVEAGILADHLSKINDERKSIVTGIMREANKTLERSLTDTERGQREVIVIGNPEWRVGVLGLVAGKISDQHKKPVFVWGKDENDCIKGSCRSDGSVSIMDLMNDASESFLDYGGHELAGGFTVQSDKIHFLEEALASSFNKVKKEKKEEKINYDVQADLSVVNMKNWREINKMAPFGFGNPKPIFLFEGVKIEKLKKFGKNGSGEHLEITFSDANKNKAVAISFFSNIDSFNNPLVEGLNVNLLATFDLSRFRGREELRLRIEDIF